MITRRNVLGMFAATLAPQRARADGLSLPPDDSGIFSDLLPKRPRIINVAALGKRSGRRGGAIRTIIGSQRDIRLMTIYGYARLIGYNERLELEPDILEAFAVENDSVFTFRLREGHRWSDGAPLSAEDFRYCWEDVFNDIELSPGGPPIAMRVDGQTPEFQILDPLTVRFTWPTPNPDFLPAIAAAQPVSLLLPAHYLKQFHKKYQADEALEELMAKHRTRKWSGLHIKMSRQYRPENPELPCLDPWRNLTAPPASQFIFERNPCFHRMDENGVQLPYIDRVVLNVSSSAIIPAKVGAGESDLQATGIDFADYAFLKDAETRYPVKVSLWRKTEGARFALLPNQNYGDPVWRSVIRDARFRRALSIAIDRREINKAVFFGLAKESADTVLPDSPLHQPEFTQAWTTHDPEKANRLLDEAGLTQHDDDGMRLLPDGRPAQILVETAGETTLETDVLELVTDHWRQVGLPLFIRTSQRDIFRSRAMAGEIMLSLWTGLDNGVPTADMSPQQLAPTAEDALQWPLWGVHYVTHGAQGAAPDTPEAQELLRLLRQWKSAATTTGRTEAWTAMLAIHADQVFSIGIVNQTLQPVLRSSRLHNVPDQALYGFDPTCYLGVYKPDLFWLGED